MQRARFLLRYEPFLLAISAFVEGWNDRHPHFAVASSNVPPRPPRRDLPWPDYLFPSILKLALEEAKQAFPPSPDHDPACAAMADWMWGLREECERWWPTDDYPDWSKDLLFTSVTMAHPAMVFVGACALARADLPEEFIDDPDEWIRPFSLVVRSIPFDPEDEFGHPSAMLWRHSYRRLVERLAEALGDGERSAPLTLENLAQAAYEAQKDARHIVADDMRSRMKAYRFPHLPPGLTSTTVAEYLPDIITTLAQLEGSEQEQRPEDRARRLREESGLTTAELARRFGVSRPTIDKWLKRQEEPTA